MLCIRIKIISSLNVSVAVGEIVDGTEKFTRRKAFPNINNKQNTELVDVQIFKTFCILIKQKFVINYIFQ